jgi:hypothetical protein
MTTVNVDSLPIQRPLVVGANSTGYSRKKILIPNVVTQGADSVSSVTMTNAGSGYTSIPTVSFTGGNGTGAAGSAVMKALTALVSDPQEGAGSYAPSNTITLAGGTGTAPVLTVTNTCVVNAVIVNGGGSGGADGTFTVTGTTGTGTKFQASVQFLSGAITSINNITVIGNYTANPSNLNAEPVTGNGVVGATFALTMGVLTATVSTPGALTALPTAPVQQSSSSGAGTGASFTLTYGVDSVNVSNGGVDYTTPPAVAFSGGGGTGAAGTAVIGGTNDPITVSLEYSAELPTAEYTVSALPNQPGVISYDNKTTSGIDLTLTPPSGETLVNGTMDVVIEFTS